MPRDTWSPDAYDRFRTERRQPFRDLVSLLEPRPGMRVVDLGCGPGQTTRLLHDHLAARSTVGIDRSPAMLARAWPLAGGGLEFREGDVTTLDAAEPFDVVFSNSVLHWVDDHPALLARLVRALRPGGQLALQFPANFHHPSHVLAAAVAREPPFRDLLGGWERHVPVLEPEAYTRLLLELGCVTQHVRFQIYLHRLPSLDAVVEWNRATLLTDYAARLDADGFEAFVLRYRERLGAALGDPRPYPYTYRRLLLWARVPA